MSNSGCWVARCCTQATFPTLEIAKTGVERVIETDEATATTWINQQLEALGVELP